MKQLTLITVLALTAGGFALAQQAAPTQDTQPPAPITRHHAPNAAKETARLAKQLSLTPDQTAKIEPILSDRDAQIAAIGGNASLTDVQRQEQIKDVRKATQGKIRAVLTPDQLQQMKEMRKQREQGAAPTAAPAA